MIALEKRGQRVAEIIPASQENSMGREGCVLAIRGQFLFSDSFAELLFSRDSYRLTRKHLNKRVKTSGSFTVFRTKITNYLDKTDYCPTSHFLA